MANIVVPGERKSINHVENVVRRICMRGVKIDYARDLSGHVISVSQRVPDTEDDRRLIWVSVATRIFADDGYELEEKKIISTVRRMVHDMFIHEADELFRVDGKAIFNPHEVRSAA